MEPSSSVLSLTSFSSEAPELLLSELELELEDLETLEIFCDLLMKGIGRGSWRARGLRLANKKDLALVTEIQSPVESMDEIISPSNAKFLEGQKIDEITGTWVLEETKENYKTINTYKRAWSACCVKHFNLSSIEIPNTNLSIFRAANHIRTIWTNSKNEKIKNLKDADKCFERVLWNPLSFLTNSKSVLLNL